uniref:DUF4254 domain-containing protein n=1 Tax=Panagrellus redivivus TaxID=6233 RepID=A0A7E4VZR0_PANRE
MQHINHAIEQWRAIDPADQAYDGMIPVRLELRMQVIANLCRELDDLTDATNDIAWINSLKEKLNSALQFYTSFRNFIRMAEAQRVPGYYESAADAA